MALQIPTVTIDDLRAFHANHFPHAPEPDHFLHGVVPAPEAVEEFYEAEDDGLGYYSDGTERTLTDEQIAMFRHSEIHTILRQRRLRQENGEVFEDGEAPASPTSAYGSRVTPDATTSKNADKVQTGRVEKAKSQWATSSSRTKARNKKHNKKYRKKKKEERKRQEAAGHGDDESDEWDPWHQANGPDVQKDDTVDLDY